MPRIYHPHQNGDGNDGSTAEPSLWHTSTPASHSKKEWLSRPVQKITRSIQNYRKTATEK
jgi:hypothetical protein